MSDDGDNEYSACFEEGDSALILQDEGDEGINDSAGVKKEQHHNNQEDDEIDISNPDLSAVAQIDDTDEAEEEAKDEIEVASTDCMVNPDLLADEQIDATIDEAEGEAKDEIEVSSTECMANPDLLADEQIDAAVDQEEGGEKEQHNDNQEDEIDVSSTDGMMNVDHLDKEGESHCDSLAGGGPVVTHSAQKSSSKKGVLIASDVLGMEDHDQSSNSEQKANHGRSNSKMTTTSSSKRSAVDVAINAPTGVEITARTIASSQSWLQLYGDLQQHLANAYTGSQQTVKIPDTVVFHRMKAISWYHTGSDGHGVEKKVTQGNGTDGSIELASVFRYFMEASRGKTIVASMIAYTDNSTGLSSSSSSAPASTSSSTTSAFGHLKITHVTEDDLRNLLMYNNAKDVIIPAYWILQGFVGPGKSGHVSTIVSESLGSMQSFGTMQWKNKHLLRVHPKVQEACLTVECSHMPDIANHVKMCTVKNQGILDAVLNVSDMVMRCIALGGVSQKYLLQNGIKMFFRVDKQDQLWLLWCDMSANTSLKMSVSTGSEKGSERITAATSFTEGGVSDTQSKSQSLEAMQEETRRLAAAADTIRQKIEQQKRQIAQQQQQQQQQRLTSHGTNGGGVSANPVLPNDLEDWEAAWQTVVDGKVPVASTNTTQAPPTGARVTTSTTSSSFPESRTTATNSIPQPPSSTTNNNQEKSQSGTQKNRRISMSKSRTVINVQRLNMLKLPKKMVIKPLPTMVLATQKVAEQRVAEYGGVNYVSMNNPKPPKSLASAASGWLEPEAVKMATEHAQLRLRLSRDGEIHAQKPLYPPQPRPPSGYRPHTTNRLIKGRGGRVVKGGNGTGNSSTSASAPNTSRRENIDDDDDDNDDEDAPKKLPRARPPKPNELSMNKKVKSALLLSTIPPPPPMRLPPPRPKAEGSIAAMFSKRVNAYAKMDRMKAAEASKKRPILPPGHADDLMSIVGDFVTRVCEKMVILLSRSTEAARTHKQLLMEEELEVEQTLRGQTKNGANITPRASKMILPRLLMDDDEEEEEEQRQGHGKGERSKQMVANIVSAVKRSETVGNQSQQKQSSSYHINHNHQGTEYEALDGGLDGRSEINGLAPVTGATNRNHMLEVPRTTDFVYKKKNHEFSNANANSNNNRNPSPSIGPHINGSSSGNSNNRNSTSRTTHTMDPAEGEEGEEDVSSEGSFLQVVKVMHCVPNHRPVEELCTVLLWLLSSSDDDTTNEKTSQHQQGSGSKTGLRQTPSSSSSTSNHHPSFDIEKAMAFTDAFAQFVKHTTACTKQITKVSTERGSTSEKDAKLKWRCAMSLRSWYCERMRSRVLNAATILTEQRNLHNSFARSKSGRFSIASNINKVTTDKSIETDVPPAAPSSTGEKAPWVNILHKPMRDDGQKPGSKGAVGRYAAAVVSTSSVHSVPADSEHMNYDGGISGGKAGSVHTNASSALRHQPRAPANAPTLVLKLGRPVSAGVIRRLGNNQAFDMDDDNDDDHDHRQRRVSESIPPPATTTQASCMWGGEGFEEMGQPVDQIRTFTVRVHVGLDTFVTATGMDEMVGITSSSSSSMQPPLHWHNGIVPRAPHEVENAFQEVSKSLIPMVAESHVDGVAGTMEGGDHDDDDDDDDDFNSTAGEVSIGGTPDSPSRRDSRGGGKSTGQRGQHHHSPTSPTGPSSVNKSLSAGSMDHSPTSTTPSPSAKSIFSEVSKVTEATTIRMQQTSSSTTTGKGQGLAGSSRLRPGVHTVHVREDADRKERLFHKLAPPLNAKQRFLVVASLLSDVARSILLGVSVLVKHAAAGHVITYRDLEIVLGIPCVAIVGRPALAKLLSWLRANLRSDINFKVASQTYTDTGLQRLFAFWPQLVVEVVSDGSPVPDTKKHHDSSTKTHRTTEKDHHPDHHQGTPMIPAMCCVRLLWGDRHWTSRLFREPDDFQPSINQI